MSRIFISAAHKSSGKTTVSIGLCAAIKQRGLQIQSFKKGPDYIDPYWLAQASGKNCYNLDFFTMERDEIVSLFHHQSKSADIALIEGNKGLYDGLDLDGSNSNAALTTLLKTPVILVLNARGMTRGIAPLILGYQAFNTDVAIKGVILNQLGGKRHEDKLRRVIEHYTDVEVIGAIHNDSRFDIEERHLGLIPGHEDPFCNEKISLLADAINDQVDIDVLLNIAAQVETLPVPVDNPSIKSATQHTENDIRLGLIRCSAFGFYYPDDLQALQDAGAEIIEIDPCLDTALPDIDAMFIGGGFPETHMQELENNVTIRQAIKSAIEQGLPVYAECGGLMYLAHSIKWNDKQCRMVGIIDTDIIMEKKPQGRGYVQLEETDAHPWPQYTSAIEESEGNRIINAHEFHYSRFNNIGKNAHKNVKFAFSVKRGTGIDGQSDGYIYNNMLANYTHQRNTRNNPWAERFIDFARTCKSN